MGRGNWVLTNLQSEGMGALPGQTLSAPSPGVNAPDVGSDVGDDGHGKLERHIWLH